MVNTTNTKKHWSHFAFAYVCAILALASLVSIFFSSLSFFVLFIAFLFWGSLAYSSYKGNPWSRYAILIISVLTILVGLFFFSISVKLLINTIPVAWNGFIDGTFVGAQIVMIVFYGWYWNLAQTTSWAGSGDLMSETTTYSPVLFGLLIAFGIALLWISLLPSVRKAYTKT